MTSKKVVDRKIQKYKEYLAKPYWELQEGVSILCGATEFVVSCPLDPKIAASFCINSFDFFPEGNDAFIDMEFLPDKHNNKTGIFKMRFTPSDSRFWKSFSDILEAILKAIETNLIESSPLPIISSLSSKLSNYSYLSEPYEMIAVTITEGFPLPDEFQIASNIFISKTPRILTIPHKKQVIRNARASFQWHKDPTATRKTFGEELKRIKTSEELDCMYASEERSRKQIMPLKPTKGKKPSPIVPGIIEKRGKITYFNYQRLKISLNTISELLLSEQDLNEEQLLDHPLIKCYLLKDKKIHNDVVLFCLKNALKTICRRNSQII